MVFEKTAKGTILVKVGEIILAELSPALIPFDKGGLVLGFGSSQVVLYSNNQPQIQQNEVFSVSISGLEVDDCIPQIVIVEGDDENPAPPFTEQVLTILKADYFTFPVYTPIV